jgi:hypothetical protein
VSAPSAGLAGPTAAPKDGTKGGPPDRPIVEPWFSDYKDVFTAYEAGKKRRYDLLFAVNGGVLAIANISPTPWRTAILALAMVAFTAVMTVDIWYFGDRFHKKDNGFFGDKGRLVLWSICAILCFAWLGITVVTLTVRDVPNGTTTAAMTSAHP